MKTRAQMIAETVNIHRGPVARTMFLKWKCECGHPLSMECFAPSKALLEEHSMHVAEKILEEHGADRPAIVKTEVPL